ncbi:MAG: manganese-binding transcriptional regulator MntR [Hyphomicrobiales bacterium]|nr:manganese-binding transcriptional regulator MntR [Hyphomicrobiales bacterium]
MGPGGTAASARRFAKARAERGAELLEDYSEMIDDLARADGEARATDVAAAFGVAHPTALKAIARLKREGLATSKPYRGVFLTPAGRALARRARARHRLVVDLLVAVGVPRATAERDAEGIEHHVSEAALRAFRRFLGARART